MKFMKRFGLTIITSLIAVSVNFAAEQTFEKSLSATSGQTLHLVSDRGSISVEGADLSSVTVRATVRGSKKGVSGFQISAELGTDGVSVFGKDPVRGRENILVDFLVKVPREYDLDVRTAGGPLQFSGITGRVKGSTGGGSLTVRNMKGTQDLRSGGGSIVVEDIHGAVVAETGGGSISVRRVAGNVRATDSGGPIVAENIHGTVTVETKGGSIKISGGDGEIQAVSLGGPIEIFVPKTIAATIDASSGGGEVVCDLPVTPSQKVETSRLQGTVNGGGIPIHAHTDGGSIKIRAE